MKAYTVTELMQFLYSLHKQGSIQGDSEVWLSSDEEGNSFSPLLNNPEISVGIEGGKIIFYPSTLHTVTEI